MRLCLDCGQPTAGTRCAPCFSARARARQELRGRDWPRVRAEVLDRWGHVCGVCGVACPHPRHHHVDHRVPLVRAPRLRFAASNLWPLCAACDRRYGGRA